MSAGGLGEAEFVERLTYLMARHRDPELHTAIWDYREGALSRRRLLTHPAFAAAMREDAAGLRVELDAQGCTREWMRARLVEELGEQGRHPPGEGEVDIVEPVLLS